jgi:hypothetical protein
MLENSQIEDLLMAGIDQCLKGPSSFSTPDCTQLRNLRDIKNGIPISKEIIM